ncbi:MAG: class I SAM-dependent methyltransferase [Polyangiales bacterium]|nr:methyltransferase domain-containing protein [Myxococcales bacterium]MCB9658938.1 methyltransferase domain-containing protein [Sandaracinaceae bacterium]
MSEDAANASGSRMRHRPLRVPVDDVVRHSVSEEDTEVGPNEDTTAVDLLAVDDAAPGSATRPSDPSSDATEIVVETQEEEAPQRISRSSVVAMKSVIVTGAAGRALSKPPPPPTSKDMEQPASLTALKAGLESAGALARGTVGEDSGEVELVVEAADAAAASEIASATAEIVEDPSATNSASASITDFDPDVSTEITIEGVADAVDDAEATDGAGDDDILEMEDLEEVAPSVPPAAAPAIPATPAAAAAPATPPSAASSSASAAPNTPPGAPKRRPWFDDFFSDDYLRTVRAPTPKEVARECDAILAMLKLDPGAIILDVGCGLGMHAIELTLRGYIVIGLDLSLPMLSRAADEAQDRGIKINFLHADMREMVFEGGFDAVLCWGTTFGYFDDEGNRSVIERFYSALKPGGRLLVDVVNRDHVIQSQPNLVWFEGDGCICMEETDFNYYASRLNVKRNVILDNGRQHDRHYSIRLYALHEMGMLLQNHGFRVVEVTGRYATPGVFFGAQSPRMIVLAERRQSMRDTPSMQSVPPPPPPSASNGSGNGDGAKGEAKADAKAAGNGDGEAG